MADYSKNTVVQIREIFKERGIPATGLTKKQQLIDRLLEHDAELAGSAPTEAETEQPNGDGSGIEKATSEEVAQPSEHVERAEEQDFKTDDAPTSDQDGRGPDNQPSESAAVKDSTREEIEAAADEAVPDDHTIPDGNQKPLITNDYTVEPDVPAFDEVAKIAEASTKNVEAAASTPTSENRKRKRRSITPPVDATEVANKKAKQDEDVHVVLKEDLQQDGQKADLDEKMDITEDNTAIPPVVAQVAADESKAGEVQQQAQNAAEAVPNPIAQAVAEETQARKIPLEALDTAPDSTNIHEPTGSRADSPIAPTKIPPGREGRYKELISPTTREPKSVDGAIDAMVEDEDDRSVPPATHPATTSLYIRDLMRPLKDAALKAHIAQLARSPAERSAPSSASDNEVVPTFYLDSIKTHGFATFSSLAAASRVRNGLHERVWPAEGNRKALCVDFIPQEKVQTWIDMELQTGGGRASTAKRWEVVYEKLEDGNVVAELQESTGASAPAPRRSNTNANIPTDPAADSPNAVRKPAAAPLPAVESAPSFVALDNLFKSTAAKPKLYFQPVAKALVDKRLEELDARTSRRPDVPRGGIGLSDSTRFTFENGDLLVDNGPEFGMRGGARGGFRGGGRGGYRGR